MEPRVLTRLPWSSEWITRAAAASARSGTTSKDNGWLDLYVANNISDNALYLNQDGRFEETGLESWVAELSRGDGTGHCGLGS